MTEESGAQADRAAVCELDKEQATRREGKGLGALQNPGRRTAWLQRVPGASREV